MRLDTARQGHDAPATHDTLYRDSLPCAQVNGGGGAVIIRTVQAAFGIVEGFPVFETGDVGQDLEGEDVGHAARPCRAITSASKAAAGMVHAPL
jgi:hypothetical protein